MSEIERKWSVLEQWTEKGKLLSEIKEFLKKSILDEEKAVREYNHFTKKLERLGEYALAQRVRREVADDEQKHQAVLLNVLRELRER